MSASKQCDPYQDFQNSIFQQLRELEDRDRDATTARFISVAATVGFTIDDLLGLLDSGGVEAMTGAVFSRFKPS